MATTLICATMVLSAGVIYSIPAGILIFCFLRMFVLLYLRITKKDNGCFSKDMRLYAIQNKGKLFIATLLFLLCSYSLSCWVIYLFLQGC